MFFPRHVARLPDPNMAAVLFFFPCRNRAADNSGVVWTLKTEKCQILNKGACVGVKCSLRVLSESASDRGFAPVKVFVSHFVCRVCATEQVLFTVNKSLQEYFRAYMKPAQSANSTAQYNGSRSEANRLRFIVERLHCILCEIKLTPMGLQTCVLDQICVWTWCVFTFPPAVLLSLLIGNCKMPVYANHSVIDWFPLQSAPTLPFMFR